MPVDAILIIRVWVCEIIGQARDGRKFKACGGIEIGITESVVPGRQDACPSPKLTMRSGL